MKDINPNLLIVGGLFLFGLTAGKKILEALGLSPDENDKENAAALSTMQAAQYFDPDFYKKEAGAIILTVAGAQNYARILYDADHVINDDEAAVYGVFQQLKTKAQVSFLAAVFFNMYKKSLLGYLSAFLDNNEMANVAKICNRLPNYKP